jgi:hypothetical protein
VVNACAVPSQKGPKFNNSPKFIVSAGTEEMFDLGLEEDNGDSIVCSMGRPMANILSPVTFLPPYSTQIPLPYLGAPAPPSSLFPPAGLRVNRLTGAVSFRPMGTFAAPFKIEVAEYRRINGVPTLLGVSTREFMIHSFIAAPNNNPYLKLYDSLNQFRPNGGNISLSQFNPLDPINIEATKPFKLSIASFDFDFLDKTQISWKLPNSISNQGGQMIRYYSLPRPSNLKHDSIYFLWTPSLNAISDNYYTIFLTVNDLNCPISGKKEYALKIKVIAPIIPPPPKLKINLLSFSSPACIGDSNGNISVSTINAKGFVNYTIQNKMPQASNLFSNLKAGFYKIMAIDSTGQKDSLTITLYEPQKLVTLPAIISHPKCFNDSNGRATLNASGGNPPYTYVFNQIQSIQNQFQNLYAGKYHYQIIDQKSCFSSDSIFLLEPTPLKLNISTKPDSCNPIAHGTAMASVAGGTAPYSFKWVNFATNTLPYLNQLRQGNYFVTVMDSLGCTKSDTAKVALTPIQHIEQICAIHVPDPTKSKQEIIWFKTPGKRIANYQIWEAQNNIAPFTLKATVLSGANSSITDSSGNLKLKQYRLKFLDSCGRTSEQSNIAAPLQLNIEELANGMPKLSWPVPQMNITFTQYNIYRKGSNGPFILIKTLNPSINSFIDSAFMGNGLNLQYYLSTAVVGNCPINHINSYAVPFNIVLNSLNKQATNTSGFSLYPNPAQQSVTVKSLNKQPFTSIQIRSIEGKLIETYTFQQPLEEAPLQLPQLSKGLYHLLISSEGKTGVTLPLMIE